MLARAADQLTTSGAGVSVRAALMRIVLDRKLFVGIRVDNKMRDQLEHCPPRDKLYFDGSDPRYLQVLRSVEDSYIGKLVEPGTPAVSMDDLKRNILSILTRIAPGRHREDAVKVFAVDEAALPPEPEKPEPSSYDDY
jgi:hypothetical protein